MDQANTLKLGRSRAKAKVLLDSNILIYANDAKQAIGIDLLDFLDRIHGTVDWFVGSHNVIQLHNNGTIPLGRLVKNTLNCQPPEVKMSDYPYLDKNGNLKFVKLSALSGDDWEQISLCYQSGELIVVTNDSKMFKTAHAVLDGRAIAFHDFLNRISPYWFTEKRWLRLKKWFEDNKRPLRNNSSWIIPGRAAIKTN